MIDIVATPSELLKIGRVGENNIRRIVFDVADIITEIPEATFTVVNQIPGEKDAYPCPTVERVDDKVYWTITSSDVTTKGIGKCELVAIKDDIIMKSIVYETQIQIALDDTGEMPEPWTSWQTVFSDIKDEAESAAEDARSAVEDAEAFANEAESASQAVQNLTVESTTLEHESEATVTKTIDPNTGAVTLTFGIPTTGETGPTGNGIASIVLNQDYTLTINYTNGQSYTTTSIRGADGPIGPVGPAGQNGVNGNDGFSPIVSVNKSNNTATITVTDAEGTTSAIVNDGEDGISPSVAVTTITGGHQVTITDASGSINFNVMDGATGADGHSPVITGSKSGYVTTISVDGTPIATINDGVNGQTGADGYSPTASVSKSGDTATITITDKNGTTTASVSDGDDYILTAQDKADIADMVDVPVQDVQVNGTSIVGSGIANLQFAMANGLTTDGGNGVRIAAAIADVKPGTNLYRPIVPAMQHSSAFYGLAKVAGADAENANNNTITNGVGSYSETSRSKIHDLLNVPVTVTGSTPSITAKSGIQYRCGTVTEITITPCQSGICDVIFTAGSNCVLSVPSTVKWPDWFDPTALEAGTVYELNILDGIYGAVGVWT